MHVCVSVFSYAAGAAPRSHPLVLFPRIFNPGPCLLLPAVRSRKLQVLGTIGSRCRRRRQATVAVTIVTVLLRARRKLCVALANVNTFRSLQGLAPIVVPLHPYATSVAPWSFLYYFGFAAVPLASAVSAVHVNAMGVPWTN